MSSPFLSVRFLGGPQHPTSVPRHAVAPPEPLQEFLGSPHKRVTQASYRARAYAVPLTDAQLLSRRAVAVFTPTSLRQGDKGLDMLADAGPCRRAIPHPQASVGSAKAFLGLLCILTSCSAHSCFLLLATDAAPKGHSLINILQC